jgi:fermentation-respiration switch protein FrsA (DUF1100 family)
VRKNTPLDGITVIDLTQIYQGPYATFLMAKAGADVIKIEPINGEPSRIRAKVSGSASLPMAMLNTNKRGVTLNLKTEGGRKLFKEMIKRADIVIENFAPGVMDRLGVDNFHVLGASMGGMIAQHLADLAPQRVLSLTLVMTSSSAQGLPAPSDALVALLARREAGSREAALQQQADLLAALGSPAVHGDRALLLHQAEQAYDRAFNPEGVQRQLLAILAESSRVELLNRLTVPTLVVHGTADPLLPVMHGVHVAAHIKGAELKLIPGLAHRFQDAFKEPLLAAVLPHLAAHRGDLGLAHL